MEGQEQINTNIRIVGVFFTKANQYKEKFRCSLCGKLLMIHNGSLESVDFIAPKIENQFGTDVLCPRCKVIYRIVYNE